MAKNKGVSFYLTFLLRHEPRKAELDMDHHGWVSVAQLIENVNAGGLHQLTLEELERIVAEDNKGRYRFSGDGLRIKACQGHSIPWVEPELETLPPPEYLYHGTTAAALEQIMESGAILRMKRHAVHLQAEEAKAWQSACRWKESEPVVLKIAAGAMHRDGVEFGKSENDVWFAHRVPTFYIIDVIHP